MVKENNIQLSQYERGSLGKAIYAYFDEVGVDNAIYEKSLEIAKKIMPNTKYNKGHYSWYRNKYREMNETSEVEIAKAVEDEEIAEITFGLERDMQSALRANIEQLESGLKIIDGGNERITDAGRIDITASDRNGNIVVIELKVGDASPKIIAQALAYMGAVAESDKKNVRGILVAGDFHKQVIWAAKAIPNLQLKKYKFQFKFESVE